MLCVHSPIAKPLLTPSKPTCLLVLSFPQTLESSLSSMTSPFPSSLTTPFMPSTSFNGSYHAFLWSGEGARERDNDRKGEHNVHVGSIITKQGRREGNNREGGSDYTSGEASRRKGIAREESHSDCVVHTVLASKKMGIMQEEGLNDCAVRAMFSGEGE